MCIVWSWTGLLVLALCGEFLWECMETLHPLTNTSGKKENLNLKEETETPRPDCWSSRCINILKGINLAHPIALNKSKLLNIVTSPSHNVKFAKCMIFCGIGGCISVIFDTAYIPSVISSTAGLYVTPPLWSSVSYHAKQRHLLLNKR